MLCDSLYKKTNIYILGNYKTVQKSFDWEYVSFCMLLWFKMYLLF